MLVLAVETRNQTQNKASFTLTAPIVSDRVESEK